MLLDVVVAAAISLTLGTACLESWARVRYPGVLALLGVLFAIACGPLFLWKRGRQPIIPIAAIYSVLMFFAILFAAFVIAFRQGRVDL
jgi:hypothetical protein